MESSYTVSQEDYQKLIQTLEVKHFFNILIPNIHYACIMDTILCVLLLRILCRMNE